MTAVACTHPAHRMLHLAPVPCPECRGWLDRDGSVMSTATMLGRYPYMRSQIAATPRQQLPDYAPTRGEEFGALARSLIMAVFVIAVLVVLILFLTHV